MRQKGVFELQIPCYAMTAMVELYEQSDNYFVQVSIKNINISYVSNGAYGSIYAHGNGTFLMENVYFAENHK